ncbi:MAG: AAA family ATPase [Nitrososphaerales archaeon]
MSFYLTPVRGDLLIDREEELRQISSELSKPQSRIGFSLTGIRRVGKTSILYDVREKLEKKGIVVIYISIWKTIPDTVDSFLSNLFDETMLAFRNKLPLKMKMSELARMGSETLLNLLKHLKLSVDIGDDVSYTVSYVRGEEGDVAKATIHSFSLIDKLARKTRKKCVLILDEFPSIAELKIGKKMVGSSIVKAIRTINENYKNTVLVISGSYMHTMQSVALSHKAPLYKQLINMEIKPLDKEGIAEFIRKYLKRKADEETINLLLEASGGIPYNLQILGRELDYLGVKQLDAMAVERAVASIIKREGELHFREYMDIMQSTEVKVVKTMALTDAKGPKDIAEKANMQLNEVTALLRSLLDKGILGRLERGEYVFTDNLFKAWLKHACE